MLQKLLLLKQRWSNQLMNRSGHYIILLLVLISACKEQNRVTEPEAFNLRVPAHFPALTDMPNNPLTKEGVELGRRLFYDKRLSGNNQLSCASCHHQELAFSDGIALSSIGVSGKQLHRNAPALINLAWINTGLFWDGGSTNLESQAFAPITNPDEMHQEFFQLVNELRSIPDYVNRFRFVFNDPEIRTGNIAKALAQFQRTLISATSRYDRYRRKESGASLSPEEEEGMQIVQTKCGGCHAGELFTDNDYHNNGIDSSFTDDTHEGLFLGRFRVTQNANDLGKFRTPTLRNILHTAPYMHDGRIATIDAVLDHYGNRVRFSQTLDQRLLQRGSKPGIPISQQEKKAMLAFFKTLTDSSFLTNQSFSNPH